MTTRLLEVLSVSCCIGVAARWKFGRRASLIVAGLAIATVPMIAQQQPPLLPDCLIQIPAATAATTSAAFDNRGLNCVDWFVVYNSTGFSAISVELDSASDSAGSPGSFSAFGGTILLGSNPSTVLNQCGNACIAATGYYPWIRLNFVSKTGTGSIGVTAYGYRKDQSGINGAGGSGCSSPCVVIGPTNAGSPSANAPVQVAGNDGTNIQFIATDTSGRSKVVGAAASGSAPAGNPVETSFQDAAGNNLIPQLCTLSAFFDTSSSGNTLLVAASGATKIYLCHFVYQDVGTGNTVQVQQGTGATCGGSTAGFGMIYVKLAGAAEDYFLSPLVTSPSNAICVNLANATRVTGEITYGQH